jgi:hypothetical protein
MYVGKVYIEIVRHVIYVYVCMYIYIYVQRRTLLDSYVGHVSNKVFHIYCYIIATH